MQLIIRTLICSALITKFAWGATDPGTCADQLKAASACKQEKIQGVITKMQQKMEKMQPAFSYCLGNQRSEGIKNTVSKFVQTETECVSVVNQKIDKYDAELKTAFENDERFTECLKNPPEEEEGFEGHPMGMHHRGRGAHGKGSSSGSGPESSDSSEGKSGHKFGRHGSKGKGHGKHHSGKGHGRKPHGGHHGMFGNMTTLEKVCISVKKQELFEGEEKEDWKEQHMMMSTEIDECHKDLSADCRKCMWKAPLCFMGVFKEEMINCMKEKGVGEDEFMMGPKSMGGRKGGRSGHRGWSSSSEGDWSRGKSFGKGPKRHRGPHGSEESG